MWLVWKEGSMLCAVVWSLIVLFSPLDFLACVEHVPCGVFGHLMRNKVTALTGRRGKLDIPWNYQKPGGLRSLKLGRLGINRSAPNDVNMYSFKSQMALLLVCERIWFLMRNYRYLLTFCECDETHILLWCVCHWVKYKIAQPKSK